VTSAADGTISALRATHDELAAAVSALSDEQLTARSGASEWTVAQVLSHLGSGAEIALANQDFNQGVWDRWNALRPTDQAADFLAHDEELIVALDSLPGGERQTLQITLGFLPAPLPLAAYAGMRLNEAAQHSWDVRVSLDGGATISAETSAVLAEHFATDMGFLLQFTGKADALAHPAVIKIQSAGYSLVIADAVSLTTAAPAATSTFIGPLETVIRLLAGRLTTRYTPADVTVVGDLTLDDLRRVFPGY
jgi:uncharacterized protein (TIGR03083 family)